MRALPYIFRKWKQPGPIVSLLWPGIWSILARNPCGSVRAHNSRERAPRSVLWSMTGTGAGLEDLASTHGATRLRALFSKTARPPAVRSRMRQPRSFGVGAAQAGHRHQDCGSTASRAGLFRVGSPSMSRQRFSALCTSRSLVFPHPRPWHHPHPARARVWPRSRMRQTWGSMAATGTEGCFQQTCRRSDGN